MSRGMTILHMANNKCNNTARARLSLCCVTAARGKDTFYRLVHFTRLAVWFPSLALLFIKNVTPSLISYLPGLAMATFCTLPNNRALSPLKILSQTGDFESSLKEA